MIFLTLLALLSPYYQSVVEMKAVLDSPELEKNLGQRGPITSLEKNESGYLVENDDTSVQVNVEYKKSDEVGPQKFQLKFEKVSES